MAIPVRVQRPRSGLCSDDDPVCSDSSRSSYPESVPRCPRMRDPFDFDRFLLQQQLGLRQHSLPSLREPYIPQLTDQCKLDPESRAPGSPIRPPPGLTNVPLRPPGLNSFFSEAPKRPEPPLFIATRDEDILARHREAISCSSSNWQSLFGFNSNEARMKEHQEQQQQHAFDRLSQEFDRRMPMPIGTRRAPPLAASTRGLPDFFALDMPLPPGLPLPLLPPPPGFLFPLQRPRASAIDSFFSEQRAPDHSVFARQDEDLLSRHREAINNSSSNWQSLFGFRTSGVPQVRQKTQRMLNLICRNADATRKDSTRSTTQRASFRRLLKEQATSLDFNDVMDANKPRFYYVDVCI
ncbi:hypothetical protein L596_020308 [Steinernema carpocapsae]|uniref:Uncharacterized protein n=1 Tax=Steinernema carpocapsae TaxID=34508 RepID=A0A4V6A0V2_STECR|nr:hypothetical protein L596_020308 [Steinernema carpocapsae]